MNPAQGDGSTGSTLASTGTGAASGAAAGSIFGPWGTAAGAIIGAVGGLMSGLAGAKAAKYKAAIAQVQAQVARQNEQWAEAKGETDSQEIGLKAKQEIAATDVRDAASGVIVGSGSSGLRRASQEAVADFDQKMVRFNAAKAAWGDEVQARAATAQSQLDLSQAKYAMAAGVIGAGTSLLGGATGVSSKWSQGQMLGMPGFGGDATSNYGYGGTAP